MRRTVFLILIAVTLLITASFCWREFEVPDIKYVDDSVDTDVPNQIIIKRLYASAFDENAYAEALADMQNITQDAFDEDIVFTAAGKSGNPEFYPAFNFSVYTVGDDIYIRGFIDVRLAEGQKFLNFKFGALNFEAVANRGLTFESVDVTPAAGYENIRPTLVNSDEAVFADLSKAASFDIKMSMSGNDGSATLQYVYTIESDTFILHKKFENLLLRVQVDITADADGNIQATFTREPVDDTESE